MGSSEASAHPGPPGGLAAWADLRTTLSATCPPEALRRLGAALQWGTVSVKGAGHRLCRFPGGNTQLLPCQDCEDGPPSPPSNPALCVCRLSPIHACKSCKHGAEDRQASFSRLDVRITEGTALAFKVLPLCWSARSYTSSHSTLGCIE